MVPPFPSLVMPPLKEGNTRPTCKPELLQSASGCRCPSRGGSGSTCCHGAGWWWTPGNMEKGAQLKELQLLPSVHKQVFQTKEHSNTWAALNSHSCVLRYDWLLLPHESKYWCPWMCWGQPALLTQDHYRNHSWVFHIWQKHNSSNMIITNLKLTEHEINNNPAAYQRLKDQQTILLGVVIQNYKQRVQNVL